MKFLSLLGTFIHNFLFFLIFFGDWFALLQGRFSKFIPTTAKDSLQKQNSYFVENLAQKGSVESMSGEKCMNSRANDCSSTEHYVETNNERVVWQSMVRDALYVVFDHK